MFSIEYFRSYFMTNSNYPQHLGMAQSAIYRIRISGFLDVSWADRFGGLNISEKKDPKGNLETVLVGRLADQSELSGILNTLHDSQMPVLSVECLEEI